MIDLFDLGSSSLCEKFNDKYKWKQIKETLERFKPNSVERVKKLKDYAFVHFKERDDALHAMNLMNGI